jgi:curli biogenesis system outer membrane secretion channel CsgG
MKKSLKLLSCAAALLLLSGCFSSKPYSLSGKASAADLLSPYQGPQAKIAVNDFELKTSGVDPEVSLALKEYLLNVLNSTKRFIIVAPQDADVIISVGIVDFVPENSGGKGGLAGGGSSASSFMGGLLGEVLNKANMQLNLRIIDRATSELINSRDIQSQVIENPGKKVKFPQDKIFRDGLSDYLGTPMGKVIYDCIMESARYIVQNIPQSYYTTKG